jgi:hypothetical protein
MEDEIKEIKSLESKKSEFANAELFLAECSSINNYAERLDSLYTKTIYDELYDDASSMITTVKNASYEVKNSDKVKHLLSIILCLGNYLNTGQRGGAYGFKLDAITMLIFTKSTIDDRNYSLMHFLVDFVETKYPELLSLNKDMPSVTDAGKVNMKDINAIMTDINVKLKEVEKTLEKTKEGYALKLKELFLENFDAFKEYTKDEVVVTDLTKFDENNENNENDENEENEENDEIKKGNEKKNKKDIISFLKFKKGKHHKGNKENIKENNDENNTVNQSSKINNENTGDKEDITDISNLLTDEEKMTLKIEEYEIDTTQEKFGNEIVKRFNDKFILIMQSFLDESRISYEKLKNFLKEANEDFANLCRLFGEDPEDKEPSELFTLFNDFWDQFQTAKIENARYNEMKRREKERERKLKERKERKSQKEKQDHVSSPTKKQSVSSENKDQIIDNIINSIRTGSAFAPGQKKSKTDDIKSKDTISEMEKDRHKQCGKDNYNLRKDAVNNIRNHYRFKQLQNSLNNLNKSDNTTSSISLNTDYTGSFQKLSIENFNSKSIIELSANDPSKTKGLCKISKNVKYKVANI